MNGEKETAHRSFFFFFLLLLRLWKSRPGEKFKYYVALLPQQPTAAAVAAQHENSI